MLLKSGYRHVYISRKFAAKHGFIPPDAAPGHYGYGGLVNIGQWSVTLTPSSTQPSRPGAGYQRPEAFNPRHSPPNGSPDSTPTPHNHGTHPSRHTHASSAAPHVNGGASSVRSVKSKHQTNGHAAPAQSTGELKAVTVDVYLSEEPHFDVVLGRSFFEKRQVKISTVDPTDVVCLDTGEKIECELVILKDGRGEIVTVT